MNFYSYLKDKFTGNDDEQTAKDSADNSSEDEDTDLDPAERFEKFERRFLTTADQLFLRGQYAKAAYEYEKIHIDFKDNHYRIWLCEAFSQVNLHNAEKTFFFLKTVWPRYEEFKRADYLTFYHTLALAFFLVEDYPKALQTALMGILERDKVPDQHHKEEFDDFIKMIFDFYPEAVEETENLSENWLDDFFEQSFDSRSKKLKQGVIRRPTDLAKDSASHWLEKIRSKSELDVERAAAAINQQKYELAAEGFSGEELLDTTDENFKLIMEYCRQMCYFKANKCGKALEGLEGILQNRSDFVLANYGKCVIYQHFKYLPELRIESAVTKNGKKAAESLEPAWPKPLKAHFPEWKSNRVIDEVVKFEKFCNNPPKPLVVCKAKTCQHADAKQIVPNRREIYRDDGEILSFGGYHTMTCSEKCEISLHTACWKAEKKEISKGLTKEKDILLKPCLTPDCNGKVIKLVITRDNWEEKILTANLPVEEKRKPSEDLTPQNPTKEKEKRKFENKKLSVSSDTQAEAAAASSHQPAGAATSVKNKKVAPAPNIDESATGAKSKVPQKTPKTAVPVLTEEGGAISKARNVRIGEFQGRDAYAQTVESELAKSSRKEKQLEFSVKTEKEITYYLFNTLQDATEKLGNRRQQVITELDVLSELLTVAMKNVSLLKRIPNPTFDDHKDLVYQELYCEELRGFINEIQLNNDVTNFNLTKRTNLNKYLSSKVGGDKFKEALAAKIQREPSAPPSFPNAAMPTGPPMPFPGPFGHIPQQFRMPPPASAMGPPPPLMDIPVRGNAHPFNIGPSFGAQPNPRATPPPQNPRAPTPPIPRATPTPPPVVKPKSSQPLPKPVPVQLQQQKPPQRRPSKAPSPQEETKESVPLKELLGSLQGSFKYLNLEDFESIAKEMGKKDYIYDVDQFLAIADAKNDQKEREHQQLQARRGSRPVGAVSAAELEQRLLREEANKKASTEDAESYECSICLEPYEEDDSDKNVLECGHKFHDHCIKDWQKISTACPLCRKHAPSADEYPTLG